MRALIAATALLLAAHPHPSGADAPPSLSRWEKEQVAAGGRKGEGERETPDQVARRYGLAGEVLVGRGGKVLLDRGYGSINPAGGAKHEAGGRWRLASITKQVTAALLLAKGFRAGGGLDAPMPGKILHGVTMRQLLTHHSGLANPDTTAVVEGVPGFYASAAPDLTYCLSQPARPGAAFAYNNCDYLVVGVALGAKVRWPAGMAMAGVRDIGVPGFAGGKPEPRFALASWGAAGGLMGTAQSVWQFDRSLMDARLLSAEQRDTLWTAEGNGSYQALGQWVFPGKLKGCAAPKRIVQRDGEIYGVQARNFILPDDDLVVIVFTNRSSDDFAIGEIWEGKGFAYDLLSAAAGC